MAYRIKGDTEVSRGLGLGRMTTAERTAYTPASEGYMVWDSDLNQIFVWDGTIWNLTSDVLDTTAILDGFTNTGGVAPVEVVTNGISATRLEDANGAAFAVYSLATNLPLSTSQYARIKIVRQTGGAPSMVLRAVTSGGDVVAAYLNVNDGTSTFDVTGGPLTAPVPILVESNFTDGTLEWVIQFSADATYTTWELVPAALPSTGTSAADLDSTLTGVIDVSVIDLNDSWRPSSIQQTRLNASGAVISLTLPPANGSNDPIFYVLDDKTNSASVTVTAGESLNGITNGSFTFSAYDVGTQFLASDQDTGEWVISVIGTAFTSLNRVRYTLSADGTGIVCPFDEAHGDVSAFTNTGGTITVPPGSYRLEVFATRQAAVLDYELFNVTTGVTLERFANFVVNDSVMGATAPYYLTVTTPTDIQVREGDGVTSVTWNGRNSGNDLGFNNALASFSCYLDIQEIPASTVVFPDALIPEPLSFATYTMTADSDPGVTIPSGPVTNFQRVDDFDTTNITENTTSGISSWTLVAGNRYKLTAQIRLNAPSSTAGLFGWYNNTDSVQVGGEGFLHSINNASNAGATEVMVAIVEPTVDTEYYVRNNAGSGALDVAAQGSWVTIEQIPSVTVGLSTNQIEVTGGTGVLGQSLLSNGDGTASFGAGSGNNRVHADDTTVNPGSNGGTAGNPSLAEIQTFVTNTAIVDTLVYYTGDDLPASTPTYVYWVDAAGVVTLTDQSSINDQSSSGYIDIGNTRIQWGRDTTTAGTAVVSLPVPMANTAYAINITAASTAIVNMTYTSDTTTGFTALDHTGGTISFSWTVVGEKP